MNNQPHYFSNKMLKILSSVCIAHFFICPAFSMDPEAGRSGSSASGPSMVHNSSSHDTETEADRVKRMISSSLKRSLRGASYEAIDNKNLRMFCVDFPYSSQEDFCRIAGYLFQVSLSFPNLERTDLMLDAYSGRHGIPLMRITAIRYLNEGSEDSQELKNLAMGAFRGTVLENIAGKKYRGTEVLDTILSNAEVLRKSPDPTIDSIEINKVIEKDDIEAGISSYAQEVHFKLVIKDDTDNYEGCSYRFQLRCDNGLDVSGYEYTPGVIKYPSPFRASFTAADTDLMRAAGTDLMRLGASLRAADVDLMTLDPGVFNTVNRFGIISHFKKGPIKGFRGNIYQQGDLGYGRAIEHYAKSSYPNSIDPFMVAYPLDADDIIAAIKYVNEQNKHISGEQEKKHIVARSGGHHYTGKSSEGKNTIVLSMDNFQEIKPLDKFNNVIPTDIFNNIADNDKGRLERIEVGPGVKLTVLSRQLKAWGITIPHGECPQVAIGGHAQTGGYGHLVRSFGLTLDYVESFNIVLAKFLGKCREATITRPKPSDQPPPAGEKFNQEIFRGVLGGNAGSFGIITKYVFNYIKDSDHTNSYGFKLRRSYDGIVFRNLMDEARKWTQEIEEEIKTNKENDKLRGLDFMMSVETHPLGSFFPSALLVELVHSDLNNKTPYTDQFKSIIEAAMSRQREIDILWSLTQGKKSLSKLSDLFVRRGPATTCDGREFQYPYKKRINCTMKSLTDVTDDPEKQNGFIEKLVEKINDVTKMDGVYLVFQMLFGGGAHKFGHEEVGDITITSIPHRNLVYGFVFDLFYEESREEKAVELQNHMQAIIDRHFNHGQERRVFWGTFDDTNISNPAIRAMYYDSEAEYARMQELKAQVDPEDIFHTELTVQLP